MARQRPEIWILTYDIKKVNGQPYPKDRDMIRAYRQQLPRMIKEGAEKLAERFDFASVAVKAKSTNTGEEFTFTHESDHGTRDEWVTGRQ